MYGLAINNIIVATYRTRREAASAFDAAGAHWKIALLRNNVEIATRWGN